MKDNRAGGRGKKQDQKMKAVWAYFTIRARHSGPLGELEDLAHDFQPGGNLPQEEQESQGVQGDVGVPGGFNIRSC